MKKTRIACYLFAGLALCAATAAMPVFSAPPPFIALNITGIALVSYALGPLAGGLFGAFTHIAPNSFGMGSGIIGFVLLTRLVEGMLPGALDRAFFAGRARRAWLSPFLGALALTLLVRPLGTTLAWLLSPYAPHPGESTFLAWFGEDMHHFFRSGLGNTLAANLLSCLAGWAAARLPDFLRANTPGGSRGTGAEAFHDGKRE